MIDRVHNGVRLGVLRADPRQGQRLGHRDMRFLRELSGVVAVTAAALRLGDQLEQATEQLQRSQREERQRLRRDLHDGLGPSLASLRLRLSTAQAKLGGAASEVFDGLRDDVTFALREVRRIADGLQPSVLEDLGLVPAMRLLVEQASDSGMLTTLDAPLLLAEPLPGDVVASIYRITAEALSNAVRHSRGWHCDVMLGGPGPLVLEVSDDGVGFECPICRRHRAAVDARPRDGHRWQSGGHQRTGPGHDTADGVTNVSDDEALRVIIADDHPIYRDGLVPCGRPDQRCRGHGVERRAGGGDGASQLDPDVVVMDLRMGGIDRVEATRQITRAGPHIADIVLSMFDDDDLVFSAIRAGARGYLLKDADEREIRRAVTGVGRGEAIFGRCRPAVRPPPCLSHSSPRGNATCWNSSPRVWRTWRSRRASHSGIAPCTTTCSTSL